MSSPIGNNTNPKIPAPIKDNPPKEKGTLKPTAFANLPPRDKSRPAAPKFNKFTLRTPREGLSTSQDSASNIALSPHMEGEPPIIRSGVDLSEINFFKEEEEEENLRARSDAPIVPESEKATSDIVDESSGNSGAPSKIDSSEEQPAQAIEPTSPRIDYLKSLIPNKKPPPLPINPKPSQLSKLEPTRTGEPDLGTIVSPRERKKAPLLQRTDRTSTLDKRVKASNVLRPSTRRSALPKLAPISSSVVFEEQPFHLPKSEQAFSDVTANIPPTSIYTEKGPDERSAEYEALEIIDLPPLPPENPEGGLTKIKIRPAFLKTMPGGTPDAVRSPRKEGPLTKRGPAMEIKKFEELNIIKADSENLNDEYEVEQIEIYTETMALQEEGQKSTDEADEFVERSEEFPFEKQKSANPHPPTLAHRTRLPAINPTTYQEVFEIVKYLIEVDIVEVLGAVRAIKALHSAAGGSLPVDPDLPESRVYSKRLVKIPNNKRYECFKLFFDALEPYLPYATRNSMRTSLANLYSHTYMSPNDSFIEIELHSIRRKLETDLAGL